MSISGNLRWKFYDKHPQKLYNFEINDLCLFGGKIKTGFFYIILKEKNCLKNINESVVPFNHSKCDQTVMSSRRTEKEDSRMFKSAISKPAKSFWFTLDIENMSYKGIKKFGKILGKNNRNPLNDIGSPSKISNRWRTALNTSKFIGNASKLIKKEKKKNIDFAKNISTLRLNYLDKNNAGISNIVKFH